MKKNLTLPANNRHGWLNSNAFPQMKVPSAIDDAIFAHIKSSKSSTRKKSLWSRTMRYQFVWITAALIVIAGIFMVGPTSNNFDTTSIDDTIGEIDTLISYLDDDSQREFDDL